MLLKYLLFHLYYYIKTSNLLTPRITDLFQSKSKKQFFITYNIARQQSSSLCAFFAKERKAECGRLHPSAALLIQGCFCGLVADKNEAELFSFPCSSFEHSLLFLRGRTRTTATSFMKPYYLCIYLYEQLRIAN